MKHIVNDTFRSCTRFSVTPICHFWVGLHPLLILIGGLLLGGVGLFAIPRTVACQALQSMGFSRQVYWSGLPFPSPGDFSNPWIEPGSPALWVDSLPTEPSVKLF